MVTGTIADKQVVGSRRAEYASPASHRPAHRHAVTHSIQQMCSIQEGPKL